LINPRPKIATPAGTIPRTKLDVTNPAVNQELVDQMSFNAHLVLDTSCFMFVAENFKGDVGMSRARKMTAYNKGRAPTRTSLY
jgi:hypothetical protein